MRKGLVAAACIAAVAAGGVFARRAPQAYRISAVPLPGDGRGDYITVDREGGRLYVTHSASVHILDLATLKPVAALTGLRKAHGVAVDHPSGHGFASDGGANALIMFDLVSGARIKEIAVGRNPDSILRDPASGKIFVFNGTTKDASVIDPASGEVVVTIPLGDKPEFSQADGKGMVWVALEESGSIAAIDTRTMELVRTFKLAGCEGTAPLALDAVHRRLFTACGDKRAYIVDADSGKVIANVPVGEDPDGIVYDPVRARLFVANRDGTMTIVRQRGADHYAVERNLPTPTYAKTVAIDPASHRVFSSTADLIWPEAKPGQEVLPGARAGTFRLVVITGR
jgi:DNA-binding beta-propeller fold protein YncE